MSLIIHDICTIRKTTKVKGFFSLTKKILMKLVTIGKLKFHRYFSYLSVE